MTHLDAEGEVENAVRGIHFAVGLLPLLDEQAEGVVELVGSKLQDVRLEGLHVPALGPSLLQLRVLADHPVLPCVDAVGELKFQKS